MRVRSWKSQSSIYFREKQPLEGYEDGRKEEIAFSAGDGDTSVIEVEKEIENTKMPGVSFVPKIGDDTNIVGMLMLGLLALVGMIALVGRIKCKTVKKCSWQITVVGETDRCLLLLF